MGRGRISSDLVDDPLKRFSKKGSLPERFRKDKSTLLRPDFKEFIELEWADEL